ncbi:MAG TPA: (2Fe-2S)-binding protein [Ktedonobacter sp.]|jgi:carbon-monoxide dehydrogenase small subunit|nr:(2Fe-2S)-binding protein [Ktedonobacter sp.]HAT45189.1 (2Fe-2S)-binding protein [Ktedonobacter sp.]HBE25494.1 (2Fe-2S)-binding protein [Ktedonobacter sp.]HCF86892.1 (2Fe-2S)-binding protein [Ktedonobacter sp.]HCJ36546.1 (2Fe-2S)-binding protein [Ktedonobacter sp.]
MQEQDETPTFSEVNLISVTVNGHLYERQVSVRMLLSDFLRHVLHLTGTHVGCEHGVCGCCTVLLNGEAVRSCLMLAVQSDGMALTTIEGMAGTNSELHPIQQAFQEKHGLQCGFCTPGIIMSVHAMLHENPNPTEEEIRHELSGNLCRCTGYQNIVEAVKLAAERLHASHMEVE